MWNCLTLDIGYSYSAFPAKVSDLIAAKLHCTIGLLMFSLIISFTLGNLLGALMIWSGTPKLIKFLIPFGMIFTSIPTILAGLFLLYVFAFSLRMFPLRGTYTKILLLVLIDFIFSIIHHGTLPNFYVFVSWCLGTWHAWNDDHGSR